MSSFCSVCFLYGDDEARMTTYALDPLRDSRHKGARSARDLADWLAWLEVGNKAARTLDTYERYGATLLRAFPDHQFSDFTDGDLLHVLKKFPPKSRHIVKASWNSWFKWGFRSRRIPGNPVDLLPTLNYRPSRDYEVFPVADAEALCALPAPDGQLMTLLFWIGLRRAEARSLTAKRLDLAQGQVLIREGAKGSKSRTVPMIQRVQVAAAELITLEDLGPNDFLWYDRPGGRARSVRHNHLIADSTFQRWWKNCIDEAGVDYRKPHMTRHSFATRMRGLGVPMEDIQEHLGHDKLSTTSDTYVHSDFGERAARMRSAVGDLV